VAIEKDVPENLDPLRKGSDNMGQQFETREKEFAQLRSDFEDYATGNRKWAAEVSSRLKASEERIETLAHGLANKNDTNLTEDTLMGYRPTVEQFCLLFAGLAEWQKDAPVLLKQHTASFGTKAGGNVTYDYASPGDVSALARSAGKYGLAHFHHFLFHAVRTYLVHAGGGYVFADVPILERDNPALSPVQIWSAATTAAKRLGILAVFGILPDDTDDAGNPMGSRSRTRSGSSPLDTDEARSGSSPPAPVKPPPLPSQNIRRVPSTRQEFGPKPQNTVTASETARTGLAPGGGGAQ
jgi:hypothetical protein